MSGLCARTGVVLLLVSLAIVINVRIARAQPAARGSYEPKPPTRRVTVPLQGMSYQLSLGESDDSTWKPYKAEPGWAGVEFVSNGGPHMWIKMIVTKMSCDQVFATIGKGPDGGQVAASGWTPSGWADNVATLPFGGMTQVWLCSDDTRRHLALTLIASYEAAWKDTAARAQISAVASAFLTAYLQGPHASDGAPAVANNPAPTQTAPHAQPQSRPAGTYVPRQASRVVYIQLPGTHYVLRLADNGDYKWQAAANKDGSIELQRTSKVAPEMDFQLAVFQGVSCDELFAEARNQGGTVSSTTWTPIGWNSNTGVFATPGGTMYTLCSDDFRVHACISLISEYAFAWKEEAARAEIKSVAKAFLEGYRRVAPTRDPNQPAPKMVTQQVESAFLGTTFQVNVLDNRKWEHSGGSGTEEVFSSMEKLNPKSSIMVVLTRLPDATSCYDYLHGKDNGALAALVSTRPKPAFVNGPWSPYWVGLAVNAFFLCMDDIRPGVVAKVAAGALTDSGMGELDRPEIVHSTMRTFLGAMSRAAHARVQAGYESSTPAPSYRPYVGSRWSPRKYGKGVRTDLMYIGTNFYDTRPYVNFRLQLLHSVKGGHSLVYGFELASGTGSGISFGGDGSLALGWGVSYPRLNLFAVATGGADTLTGDMVQDVGTAGYVGTRVGVRAYAPKMLSLYAHAAALWRFDHTDRELRLDGGMLVGNSRGFLFGASLRSFNNGYAVYSLNLGMFL